jgi:hypothetical protein
MMMSQLALKEAVKIHAINGYDKDPKAQEAFAKVIDELDNAPYANVFKAPSFNDYADAIEAIDDEPFAVY